MSSKTLVWRKKNEVIVNVCTLKGNKAGHCDKLASFFTISLGKVICYYKHYEKLSGQTFAEFIKNNFIEIFKRGCNPTGNVFIQDGDPSQNPKAAKTALDKIGAVQFSIPPRFPDLNPIEHTFNLVEKKLTSAAVKYSLSKKSLWKQLKTHFRATPQNLLTILSSLSQKEYHRSYRVRVIV